MVFRTTTVDSKTVYQHSKAEEALLISSLDLLYLAVIDFIYPSIVSYFTPSS